VSEMPQRPFVPHRTPGKTSPVVTESEFHLSRPFVPGSERATIETKAPLAVSGAAGNRPDSITLPSIEKFLDTSPAIGAASAEDVIDDYQSGFAVEPDEIPPIEHFTDPLPAIVAFAPDIAGALLEGSPVATEEFSPMGARSPQPDESGWVETDWQHFDWRAAAALGDGVEAAASNEWATTDWEPAAPILRDNRPTAAQAIASALDQIAQRIRDGELAVPGSGSLTDPATIAASLAAILGVGVRR
jgi:hypothetical protein